MGIEIKELRCVNCGAPLTPTDSEYITCEFCGFTQKVIDANSYLEKIKNEVYSWLKDIIPSASITSTTTLDPIARHNLFIYNVKPAIIGEYIMKKNKLTTILTNPLLFFPFTTPPQINLQDSPRNAFKDSTKLESLSSLTVVDEDIAYMNEVRAAYMGYAYALNILDLIKNNKPFENIKKNIEEATKIFKDSPEREAEHLRFVGLSKAIDGFLSFLNGDFSQASIELEEGLKHSSEAKNKAFSIPSASPMIPAISKEITNIATMKNLAEAASNLESIGIPPDEIIQKLSYYYKAVEKSLPSLPDSVKHPFDHFLELSIYIKAISNAKVGNGKIKILPGSGNLLIPLWIVKITYTFTTGILFAKKGKAYIENVLVAATAPYTGPNVVTDIFKTRAQSSLWDRLSGKEKTLTLGKITKMIQNVRELTDVNKIVPPIAGKKDAEEYANQYLTKVFRLLRNKIKFGASETVDLIYMPGNIDNDQIIIPDLKEYQFILSNAGVLNTLVF